VILLIIIIFQKRLEIIKNLLKLEKTIDKYVSFKINIENSIKFIIFLLIFHSFLENYFWVVTDWDALAFYDFRARVMAINGDMLEGIQLTYFFQYPPYTSLLHVFGYIFGAMRVKVAYSLITLSFLLSFYNLIRRKQEKIPSLIFTLVLASTPMIFEHSVTAYSNLPYVSFFSIGVIYLWNYLDNKLRKDLIAGGLLISMSTWIRSTEPFWIVPALLIIFAIIKYRSNIKTSIILIFIINFPGKLWRKFLLYLDKTSEVKIIDTESHSSLAINEFIKQGHSIIEILIRIFEVLKYLIITLAPEFYLIFFLLILSVLHKAKNKSIELISLVLLFSIVFGGTLVFSFTFETWNLIGGSIVRMCMIFVPLLLYLIPKDLKYEKKH